MNTMATSLSACVKLSTGLGEMLLKDVTAETFARKARVGGVEVDAVHPAFVYGHLCLYPSRALELLGVPTDAAEPPTGFADVFRAGLECRDDPKGSIYPAMEAIVSAFRRSYGAFVEGVLSVGDEVFAPELPEDHRMRSRTVTVGGTVAFYMLSHTMMHLGQVSTWRRCMGLGSAM
ncbi:MAG: DinB family protein [Phycisphaeraceae bacterium]|nr:DinB family protein [Phycisphaeraceae bacterium]